MKRAVLVVVDGLRADLLGPRRTPSLWRLAGDSRRFDAHRAVFPTATRVNAASIATGCYPAAHGLCGNTIALDEGAGLGPVSVGPPEFRERWRRATGTTLLRPTLTERLRDRGGVEIFSNSSAGAAHMLDPDGHGVLHHRSGSHGPGLLPLDDPGQAVTYDATGDALTTERFREALADPGDTALYVLWICEPDHSQHALVLGSDDHLEVLAGADRCAGAAAEAVGDLRARGEDVLMLVVSDHGHETVREIIPLADLLVAQGFKAAADSTDVVVASSGMSALVYLSPQAAPRRDAIARWMGTQPWAGEVFAGAGLARAGLPTGTALAIAVATAGTDEPNARGVPGRRDVIASPFMSGDREGHGQHGGLGPHERHPMLLASGGAFAAGVSEHPTSAVDIAPTLLRHLGAPVAGMDGRPLTPA